MSRTLSKAFSALAKGLALLGAARAAETGAAARTTQPCLASIHRVRKPALAGARC
jgi:hypothetical protein